MFFWIKEVLAKSELRMELNLSLRTTVNDRSFKNVLFYINLTSLSSKTTSTALFLQASSNQVDNSRFRVFHLPDVPSTCQTEDEL